MRVELLGSTEREYFQVAARLRGGAKNTAPSLGFAALLVAKVDQFVLTALTLDMLAAKDLESPLDLLLFSLTVPWPSPGRREGKDLRLRGYLLSTDEPRPGEQAEEERPVPCSQAGPRYR
ncbi:hypothetical protein KIL84_021054 [Mauremys mutica]|uniref:Uncharacterized protein n=1 Tax=Mauremys mutica TaxID=74926 RepID=A0A9D3XBS3_9SAUR|nr:hypothetical protein KIL84_021054 [Mauremys mutica]